MIDFKAGDYVVYKAGKNQLPYYATVHHVQEGGRKMLIKWHNMHDASGIQLMDCDRFQLINRINDE